MGICKHCLKSKKLKFCKKDAHAETSTTETNSKPVEPTLVKIVDFAPVTLTLAGKTKVNVTGQHVGSMLELDQGTYVINEIKKQLGEFTTGKGWQKTVKAWVIKAERTA